jgi:hypothetical protein
MEDKLKKNLDQVFNEQLGNQQAAFEEQDWQKMLALLEQDEVVPVVPFIEPTQQTKTKTNNWINLKNIMIMTTLALITALMTIWGNAVHENTNTPTVTISENKSINATENLNNSSIISSEKKEESTVTFNTPNSENKSQNEKMKQANTPIKSQSNGNSKEISDSEKPALTQSHTEKESAKNNAIKKEVATVIADKKEQTPDIFDKIKELPSNPLPPKDSLKKANKFYKAITHEVWVEDRYEYTYLKPKYDIEDFWIGMHYTQQRPENQPLYDSMGLRDVAHGFNIQFMSGNLLKGEYWAIYGGLDWGMQFYGRSKDSEVLINSTNQDKGLTHLRSSSTDFLARFHFEYAQFPIIPYINLAGGPRILMTGQHVSSLLTSNEYESSTSHNVANDVALMGSLGVGFRVKISPAVSLDARYEQFYGGKAQIVDLHNSQFVGTEYTLSKNKISTNSSQFKLGFIFDFSQREEEKKLVEPGHYETKTERYYLDPSDTNKIIQPCPCGPCDEKEDNSSRSIYEEGGVEEYPTRTTTRTRTINTGSGSSGGGKKSFPGVKSKPVDN